MDLTCAEAALLLAPLVAAEQAVLCELAQGTHAPARGRKSATSFSAGSALTGPPRASPAQDPNRCTQSPSENGEHLMSTPDAGLLD